MDYKKRCKDCAYLVLVDKKDWACDIDNKKCKDIDFCEAVELIDFEDFRGYALERGGNCERLDDYYDYFENLLSLEENFRNFKQWLKENN